MQLYLFRCVHDTCIPTVWERTAKWRCKGCDGQWNSHATLKRCTPICKKRCKNCYKYMYMYSHVCNISVSQLQRNLRRHAHTCGTLTSCPSSPTTTIGPSFSAAAMCIWLPLHVRLPVDAIRLDTCVGLRGFPPLDAILLLDSKMYDISLDCNIVGFAILSYVHLGQMSKIQLLTIKTIDISVQNWRRLPTTTDFSCAKLSADQWASTTVTFCF